MKLSLTATPSVSEKKSQRRALRAAGLIPAVIYGYETEPLGITIERRDFIKKFRQSIGEFTFFNVTVDGKEFNTIIREKQMHPVSREYLHIDFYSVNPDKEITVQVPVEYHGIPEGVSVGGRLEVLMRKIHMTSLPKDIPAKIIIDLSALKVGDTIQIADVDFGGAKPELSSTVSVAVVHPPKGATQEELDAEAAESEEAAAEPAE